MTKYLTQATPDKKKGFCLANNMRRQGLSGLEMHKGSTVS